jgi:hypothetical protein
MDLGSHVNIGSKGEVVRYVRLLLENGKVRECSYLKVMRKRGPTYTYYCPECQKDFASWSGARNVDIDRSGYGGPSSYSWPECPEDCDLFTPSSDFLDVGGVPQKDVTKLREEKGPVDPTTEEWFRKDTEIREMLCGDQSTVSPEQQEQVFTRARIANADSIDELDYVRQKHFPRTHDARIMLSYRKKKVGLELERDPDVDGLWRLGEYVAGCMKEGAVGTDQAEYEALYIEVLIRAAKRSTDFVRQLREEAVAAKDDKKLRSAVEFGDTAVKRLTKDDIVSGELSRAVAALKAEVEESREVGGPRDFEELKKKGQAKLLSPLRFRPKISKLVAVVIVLAIIIVAALTIVPRLGLTIWRRQPNTIPPLAIVFRNQTDEVISVMPYGDFFLTRPETPAMDVLVGSGRLNLLPGNGNPGRSLRVSPRGQLYAKANLVNPGPFDKAYESGDAQMMIQLTRDDGAWIIKDGIPFNKHVFESTYTEIILH